MFRVWLFKHDFICWWFLTPDMFFWLKFHFSFFSHRSSLRDLDHLLLKECLNHRSFKFLCCAKLLVVYKESKFCSWREVFVHVIDVDYKNNGPRIFPWGTRILSVSCWIQYFLHLLIGFCLLKNWLDAVYMIL